LLKKKTRNKERGTRIMIGWENKRVCKGIWEKDDATEVQSITNALPIEFSMGITLF
jgi:hypothetical protein